MQARTYPAPRPYAGLQQRVRYRKQSPQTYRAWSSTHPSQISPPGFVNDILLHHGGQILLRRLSLWRSCKYASIFHPSLPFADSRLDKSAVGVPHIAVTNIIYSEL